MSVRFCIITFYIIGFCINIPFLFHIGSNNIIIQKREKKAWLANFLAIYSYDYYVRSSHLHLLSFFLSVFLLSLAHSSRCCFENILLVVLCFSSVDLNIRNLLPECFYFYCIFFSDATFHRS